MAKLIWKKTDRLFKDGNSGPVADGSVTVRLGGTSTLAAVYSDDDLSSAISGSVINFNSNGYLEISGNLVNLYVADDVTIDLLIQATGFNGSAALTVPDVAIADTAETAADYRTGFKNALSNGDFSSWSGATSGSAASGDDDGDETADGWYIAQPSAASNEWSRQDGAGTGARYGYRFGRPSGSSSTNKIRIWKTLTTEEVYRLRGQTVTFSVSVKAGANFSGTALNCKLATGTTVGEDGDGIEAGSWGGFAQPINQNQAVTATITRYEFSATLGAGIKEAGVQFSYTGVGTAGANDWVQIEDVQVEIASAASAFEAPPTLVSWFLNKFSAAAKTLTAALTEAAMRVVLGLERSRNAQTGTSYTVLTGDRGKHITFSNGSSIAVTLPQAGSAGFADNWSCIVENIGAGLVTITPTTSTINGAATMTLAQGEFALITSDNTNYRGLKGFSSISAAGLALIDDASASAQRTTMGAAGTGDANTYTGGLQTISGSGSSKLKLERTGQTAVLDLYQGTTETFIDASNSGGSILLRQNGATKATINGTGLGVGITPTVPFHVTDAANGNTAVVFSSHASFSNAVLSVGTARAANSAFSLLTGTTGSGGDTEFNLRGDGTGLCDVSWTGGGADIAEALERRAIYAGHDWAGRAVCIKWDDAEDRAYVELAHDNDPVHGVVSFTFHLLGNASPMQYHGKYLQDDFGRRLREEYARIEWEEEVPDGEPCERVVTQSVEVDDLIFDVENQCFNAVKRVVDRPIVDIVPVFSDGVQIATVKRERTEMYQPTKTERRSYIVGEMPEGITPPGGAVTITHDDNGARLTREKQNPAFNANLPYKSRLDRIMDNEEWVPVCGFKGLVRWRKDNPVSPPEGSVKWRNVSADVEEWLIK